MDEQSEHRLELKRQFSDFLDQDHGLGDYPDKIKALLTKENVQRNRLRLEVDVHDLRQFNADLSNNLLREPTECVQPFEEALDELVRNAYPKILQVFFMLVQVFIAISSILHHVSLYSKFSISSSRLCSTEKYSN